MLSVSTSQFKIRVRDHVATVCHLESGEVWAGPFRDLPAEHFLIHADEAQVNDRLAELFGIDRATA